VAAASSGATEGEISLLRRSGLFDDGYYRDRAPGLPPELDALRYYLHEGWKTFTEPSPRFDPIYYVSQVPGARDMGPLLHFARYGHREKAKVRPSEPGEPYHFINYPPRPDDDVHIERFRGLAFFRQFRFAFEGESELALVPAAIADLARRPPPGLGDHNTPEVSIIIPVYGQTPFALGCLDSLARHRSRRRFEILVWDDASPDATKSRALEGIPWVRYIRSPENGGFLAACNAAVEQARGRYIVLLNSDTRVCSGWLDELIGTFDEHPEAGLVGSKLFFENGLLQEAGGIVWQDASATNYGRGDNSNLPEYCYARQADYCSGAAIALPRHLWDQLGGFDSFFSPAYYEDTDLAFRVRAAGRQVWYQSVAHVIHYEGKTHGRDLTAGGKRHQVTNGRKFLERWGAVLASHGEPGKRVRAAADRYTVGRLLALDEKLPTPDQDSGSVTTLRLLQLFMRLGWQVSFAPGFRFDRRYTADLHRLGIETFQTPAVPDLEAVVAREGAFDSVLAFRVDVLHPILESLRASYPQASILFHNMDFYHLRLRRQAEVEGNPRLLREAAIKHREELEVVLNVDCTIVPSDHERDVICAEAPLENVLVHPYVAEARSSRAGFSARKHLVFVGHFGHSPNVDAVRHFLTDIWPAVSGRLPSDARLYVVGADAPAALTRLARESVVFTGYVKDLASLLDTCRLMVAPLRYGAGIKGKVVTALSHGLPCVASPVAVEGMGLTPGQDVLVGDDAPGFINAVLELYSDQVRWEAVQASAYAFVQENYSWRAGESFVRDALAVAEVTWQRRQLAARYALLDQFQRSAGASLQPPAPQSEADETSLGRSAPKMLLPSKSAHPIVERRTAADEIRRFTSKSEYFEELRVPPTATHSKAKAIAFYLPQFHAIPENDDWWGRGFTEWSNVIRGTPRFPGHYQPRVPRDLGFYDLTDPTVLPRQVAAARAGGVHGFCYYYYNFGGTRLLEKPLEAMMNRSDVDFPFCLMWANENWSRRWDGYEEDVLIGHDYGDAEALVADFARHFADLRYIRIGGRPLLIIYRPGLIPGGRATFDQWRQLFADRHGERPYIFMAQAFEDYDPRKYGLDGALEFPPHKIFGDAPSIRGELEFFDPAATMQVYGYDTAIANAAATPAPPFPLFRTVFPTWDNDARRQGHGLTVTDSTPAKFGRWVDASIEYARAHPFEGEAFFFVNAWNEWAEGAYLEPDLHHGAAYLNTLGRAVQGA
jgi:GT2 family glycosyltransferase/glycosyltransferase involved in cell wall biosynthesis